MISMKMAYENVIDFSEPDPVPPELDLCAFTTINQKKPLIYVEHMSG
jgi:hypothetical protein